ncbi:hypothetical protein RF16_21120 [Salmonella enterica subsp. enterica]|nr:hypothetical protein [Salmonella enterica subsp. enterica]EEJ7380856.1 hypothetical protein [Salmonella enterica subsp. enterica]
MDKVVFTPFNADRDFYDTIYNNVLVANELKNTGDVKYRNLYCRLLQLYLTALLSKQSRNIPPVYEIKSGNMDKIIYLNRDNIYHALSLTAGLRNSHISRGIEGELSEAVYNIMCFIYKEMRIQARDYDPSEFQDY